MTNDLNNNHNKSKKRQIENSESPIFLLPGSQHYLIALCGLPASGKSMFAARFMQYIQEQVQEILGKDSPRLDKLITSIDVDYVRLEMFDSDFDPINEAKVREMSLTRVEKRLHDFLFVIFDDNNYYEIMRRQLKDIAQQANANYILIYISTPIKNCIEWNLSRKNPIKNEIINKMHTKFDSPGLKYKWDKPKFVFNLAEIDIDNAVESTYNFLATPKPNGIYGNQKDHKNNIQLTDKAEISNNETEKFLLQLEKMTRNFIEFYFKLIKLLGVSSGAHDVKNVDIVNILDAIKKGSNQQIEIDLCKSLLTEQSLLIKLSQIISNMGDSSDKLNRVRHQFWQSRKDKLKGDIKELSNKNIISPINSRLFSDFLDFALNIH